MISIELTYPPSANRLWRSAGKGKVYTSPEYAAWKKDAAWTVAAAVSQQGRVEGPYELVIAVRKPDRRKRDLDNLFKPISDALVAGGAIKDDSECAAISAAWNPDLQAPVSVMITPVTPFDQYIAARREGSRRNLKRIG